SSRCIIIGCCILCSSKRCLQCFQTFRRVVTFEVTICGFDQGVQFCLGNDLPQLLCRFGHRSVRCLQLICSRIRVINDILCSFHGIDQRLHLARTQSLHI